jgi:hypothetical protein
MVRLAMERIGLAAAARICDRLRVWRDTQPNTRAARFHKKNRPEIFGACLVPKCENAKFFAFGPKILETKQALRQSIKRVSCWPLQCAVQYYSICLIGSKQTYSEAYT